MRIFLMALCFTFPALAADPATIKPGIRTLTITPPAAAVQAPMADDSDAAKLQKPNIPKADLGEAPPHIAPLDSVREWPHLRGLLMPTETAEFQAAMAALRDNPGGAPPQALLYGAASLVNAGQMRDAALYQQAALLRTAFDARRFADSAAWRRYARGVSAQGAALNDATYPVWMQSPAELIAGLQALITWDRATRYAYALPDAVQNKPRPDVDTEKALQQTRAEFVDRWIASATALWPDQAEMLKAAKATILK